MSTAFLDTLYLLALVSSDDEYHEAAVAAQLGFRGRLLTTEYVLIEVLDGMTVGQQREIAIALVASVRTDKNVEVIPASSHLLDAGLHLFQQRPDKQWGITDCISFVVMREHGITEALTADHHFEQAGFKALLRQTA